MNKTVILSIAAIAVLSFNGCGNKSNNDENTKSAVETTVEKAKEATSKVAEKTKEVASATTEAVKETANKATEATKEVASNVANKAKEAVEKTTEAVKEGAQKATEATKEAASNVADKAKEVANKATEAVTSGGNEKGKAAYAKCAECHGDDGKRKALNKSEVIAGQAVADLEKKIAEYKAGSRNVAGMGQLMQGQVKDLNDEDIKAVSEYISSLK